MRSERNSEVTWNDWDVQGRNRLHLSALDKEHYCVTVHLAQQRSECEVRGMMHAPETVQEALKRVQVTLRNCPHESACSSAWTISFVQHETPVLRMFTNVSMAPP